GLAGGVNLYSYAGSNPISFSDPFGLCDPKKDSGCPLIQAVAGKVAPLERVVPAYAAAVSMVMPVTGWASSATTISLRGAASYAAASGIQANRARGLTAEALVARQVAAEGGTVLGTHVAARTSSGLRIIDLLVQSPTGQTV